jgi:hypothetical protein
MSVEQASQLASTAAAVYDQAISESDLQVGTAVIPYAATVTPNLTRSTNILLFGTLTGNITVANPLGARAGMKLTLVFTQDGTGGRTITYGAAFKFSANGAGTAGQVGATSFYYNGTVWVQDGAALTFKT